MPVVIVDGIEVEIDIKESLNGIQAARRAGVEIPHYCWHPGLTVVASCRMCLVESGRRDPNTGAVSMVPKLVPACQTPAVDGTVLVTNSEKVIQARAMVEEDLLLRHPVDCPICDKAGECALQDYHFLHGREQRRADIRPFHSRRRSLGDTVTLFVDRCVMCSRCVRFCREVAGTAELLITNRGTAEEIDVFPGFPLANKLSGNVVDLCPVGALGDKDFLYQQRVWFMRSHDSVCAGCSTGCSIKVDENQDRIYRIRPRENPEVNQWWICDEGRYGWKYVHDPRRVTDPQRWDSQQGQYVPVQWSELPELLDSSLRAAGRLGAVISPMLTVEEAYLLASYIRGLDEQAILAMGPIPRSGQDESFPSGFTIRAEKCPNRRGVEAVIAELAGPVASWEQLRLQALDGDLGGLWISGGYPFSWHDDQQAESFAKVDCLVVQDLFPWPLWHRATIRLPGASALEREGSYVNAAGLLQTFSWSIRPPTGVQTEGRLLWRLTGGDGLLDSGLVRRKLAAELPRFAAAAELALGQSIPLVDEPQSANQLV